MPTIVSEVFGVLHFGTIFNTITIAGPIGSYVMYVRVIGSIYDREATRGGTEYWFMIARGLFIRTRRLYEQIVSRRMEDVAELISVAMGWW
ncbi:hypothetical protein HanPI659440_Chr07g0263861 [Helianthus annuus]|nr:hypothetical protein HanPI659440_Chr07g0263861 [Helianthus annuus]